MPQKKKFNLTPTVRQESDLHALFRNVRAGFNTFVTAVKVYEKESDDVPDLDKIAYDVFYNITSSPSDSYITMTNIEPILEAIAQAVYKYRKHYYEKGHHRRPAFRRRDDEREYAMFSSTSVTIDHEKRGNEHVYNLHFPGISGALTVYSDDPIDWRQDNGIAIYHYRYKDPEVRTKHFIDKYAVKSKNNLRVEDIRAIVTGQRDAETNNNAATVSSDNEENENMGNG